MQLRCLFRRIAWGQTVIAVEFYDNRSGPGGAYKWREGFVLDNQGPFAPKVDHRIFNEVVEIGGQYDVERSAIHEH
jgi:hypothetical protein